MGLVAGAVDMGAAVGTAAMAAMGTAVSGPALIAAAVTLAGAGTVVAGAGGIGSRSRWSSHWGTLSTPTIRW